MSHGSSSANNGKSKVSELFSSSEEEEGNESVEINKSKPSSKNTNRSFANAAKTAGSKDDEDDFGDGFGPDLMGDDEDHRRLAAMTEVEREAILYDRAQARLAREERRALEKKMRELETGFSGSTRPVRTPTAAAEKKKRSLEELRALREKRRRRRRGEDSDSDIYDEEEGEVKKSSKKGSNQHELEDGEEDFEDEASEEVNFEEYYQSRGKQGSKKRLTPFEDDQSIDLNTANKLRITRNMLAKWMFHPNFDELCRGCLLRLSIGYKGNEQVYRLVEIKKIVKYHRIYKINDTFTIKAAILRYGKSERTFRLDVISNSEFMQAEFDRWMDTLKEEKQPFIYKSFAESKAAQWKMLEERPISDEIISQMLSTKRELGMLKRNLIAEKTMLEHLRNEAQEGGNQAEVDRIEEELAQLNAEQANSASKQVGDSRLEAIAELNKRNKKQNLLGSQEISINDASASPSRGSGSMGSSKFDPFSRRKCQPASFNALLDSRDDNHSVSKDSSIQSSNFVEKAGNSADQLSSQSPLPQSETETNGIAKSPSADLFAVHDVDIEIDI